MGLATVAGGTLRYIDESASTSAGQPQAYIRVPGTVAGQSGASYIPNADRPAASPANVTRYIRMYVLPDISDSKAAVYNNEAIPGRSFPLKTYSHSEDRIIGIQLHMVTDCDNRVYENLMYLRMLQSAVYPQPPNNGIPYYPPPVCQIICGQLLGSQPLNAILKSYSVKYPTDQAWDESTFLPAKFDVDTSWEVVYKPTLLPGQDIILLDW